MANPQTLKVTRQTSLVVALQFINLELGITNSTLARTYGLRRATLEEIVNKGIDLPRKHDMYMRVFIRVLNDKRRQQLVTNNNPGLVVKIKDLVYDLMLIEYGLPTDAEIRAFERFNKYGVR